MKIIFFLFALLFSSLAFSQEKPDLPYNVEAEKPAEFPLGYENLRKMIADNFRMRKINVTENTFCELQFIVEKNGKISHITAKSDNESFKQEAIRSLKKIKNRWKPATINGEPVRYRFRVPLNINFE